MIGALKPFLRRMRTASRPSMSGRPTSMITRSISPALAACVQRQLLGQRIAHLGIVVDDEKLTRVRHQCISRSRSVTSFFVMDHRRSQL
jgi:hypothetical protein